MVNTNVFLNVLTKTRCIINQQQFRSVPRWSHRRPAQVIEPEEYDKATDKKKAVKQAISKEFVQENLLSNTKINWKHPKREDSKTEPIFHYKIDSVKPLSMKKSNASKHKPIDMLETLIDEDGNFIYTKMDDNDVRISMIMVELKSKKEKEKKDLMLLEGKRLIKEALDAKCKLEYIIFSRIKEVEYLRPSLPKLGAKMYKMPYNEMQMWSDLTTNPGIMGIFKIPDTEAYEIKNALPITIICDNLREPNNLGAILRTSSGVGCEEILLTKGCTNLWDTKVLRSACGAHFKLRLKTKLDWDNIKQEISPDSHVFLADNNMISSSSEDKNQDLSNLITTVPIVPYYGVNFVACPHIVLIIGGETEGISDEFFKFAAERKGVRLNVPLSNNVDSLNTGAALAVIAFEIKKQLLTGK